MKNETEVIKIQSHYVGDDCIQIMIPYKNKLTLLSPEGILFHYSDASNVYINY